MVLLSMCVVLGAAGTVHADSIAPTKVSAGEMSGMQLLYAVDNNQFDFNDAYTVDNSAGIAAGSFSRVGYYVELGGNWVWVSMNTFNSSPTMVGVPKAGTGIVQNGTLVSNLRVETNYASVTPGTYANGIIEFWASNYSQGGGGLYGSSDSKFDWKDSGGSTGNGHGSFQVFTLNDTLTSGNCIFGITANGGSGLGNQIPEGSSGSQDWTFGNGTGSYATRNLEIWVGPFTELTWDGAGNGNWGDARWVGGPPAHPDASAKAVIGSDIVTVEANHAALSLTMTGGQLVIGAGNTLDVAGGLDAPGIPITLGAGSTLKAGSGAVASITAGHGATIETSTGLSASHLALAAGGTFVKAGAGTLSFDQSSGVNVIDGSNTIRVDAGELKMQALSNPIGGADLVLNGGTFTVQGQTTYQAGLLAGSHSNTNWQTVANSGNLGTSLRGPEGMIRDGVLGDIRENHWRSTHDDTGTGPDNTALIYTGQIYLTPGEWTFVEQNDDNTFLKIAGTTLLNVGGWNDANRAVFNATNDDGSGGAWYDFDVRFQNGGGGYGFSGQQNTGAGDSNWNLIGNSDTDPDGICGFRFAAGNIGDENALSYNDALDPGDGSVFRYVVGIAAIDMTDTDVTVTANSGLNAITDHTAAFGTLTLQNGILKTSGAAGGITFTGTTIAGGGTVGFDTQVTTTPGAIDGGGSGGSIVKTGAADLILNQAGTGLAGATFVAQAGRLIGVHGSNPFGTATLEVNGGEIVLSSAGGSVAYDNAVHATGSGTLTAGQAGGGVAGPLTVTLGSATNGVSIDAGKTLTLRSTDNYTLDVAGAVNGGTARVTEGTVLLNGGGTLARLEVKGGVAGTPGVTVSQRLKIGDLTFDASGGSMGVSGADLGNGASPRQIALSGGTVSIQNASTYAFNQIRGSLFNSTPDNETPLNLDGASYEYSPTRVFTGSKAGSILALTENPLHNENITVQLWGDQNSLNGWTDMFPDLTAKPDHFVTAFSGWFFPTATGSYRFRGDCDDRSLMYIDVNDDGVFDASERVGPYAWGSDGYKTLDAGNSYAFMIMCQEFAGGDSANWYVTRPGGSEVRINPGDAGQANWWASGKIAGAINEPNTHFSVAASSALDLASPTTAILGDLALAPGVTLTLTGAPGGISFRDVSGAATVVGGFSVRGTIAPGASPGQLTVLGGLAMENGSTYEWELAAGASDLVYGNGGLLTLGQWTLRLADLGGFSRPSDVWELFANFSVDSVGEWDIDYSGVPLEWGGAWIYQDGTNVYLTGLTTVPEPATMALVGLAAAGLGGYVRRRRAA